MGPSGPQKSPEATASTHETNVPRKVLILKRCWIEVPFKYPMISGKPDGEPAGQMNCKGKKQTNKWTNEKTEELSQQLMCWMHLWTLLDQFSPCSVHKQTFWKLTGDLDTHVTSVYMQKFKLPTMLLYVYWGYCEKKTTEGPCSSPCQPSQGLNPTSLLPLHRLPVG